jgi:tagatose 6-phosphate kinase
MILCVNPNAAIDKTVIVPHFHLNDIQRPQKVIALPGGKGCNVARALKCLGESSVVAGWVGGYTGRFIEEGLQQEGIGTQFVHTAMESRTCLSILDPVSNTLTELYEKGEPISPAKIAEFVDWFQREVSNYAVITLSGSLPPGVPLDFYAQLIQIANVVHTPTILDSHGEALRQGLKAKPTIIKPNRLEFEGLVGQPLKTIQECEKVAIEVSTQYETIVVISLGAWGVICAQADRVIRVRPPVVNIVSAVGSGDSLLAGIALGLSRSEPLEDLLKLGIAAGTANAMTIGAGVFTEHDLRQVLSESIVS